MRRPFDQEQDDKPGMGQGSLSTVSDEDQRIAAWNAEQLMRVVPELEPLLATQHIAAGVDWHEVARLVDQGCPAGLALEIVA